MKLNARKSNPHITSLAKKLHTISKKEQAPIWDAVSEILQGSSRNLAEVNIGQLDRITKDKDVVLVPGKLLAAGTISHALNVYAFSATESAKKQIYAAKGKFGTIEELLSHNPKGKGVRLIR